MSVYSSEISRLRLKWEQHEQVKQKLEELSEKVKDMNKQYAVFVEAQQLLGVVSEQNTNYVLDYVTGVINKTLAEMFPFDPQKVYLEKTMHAGKYPHIKVKLLTSNGETRDLVLQCGTGQRQVISFLFVVCLIELRKCRRILLMDEILSGLHVTAKRVVKDIMRIFAEEGFQFVFIEHSGMSDLGKTYIVEKPDNTATATALEGEYHNEVFIFNRPVEDVDMSMPEDDSVEAVTV